MLSIRRSARARVAAPVTDGGWATLVEEEEGHVAEQGFGAGVMVISFAPELVRHADDDLRTLVESSILSVIDAQLGWTDRTAMITAGRLGVVSVPVTKRSCSRSTRSRDS